MKYNIGQKFLHQSRAYEPWWISEITENGIVISYYNTTSRKIETTTSYEKGTIEGYVKSGVWIPLYDLKDYVEETIKFIEHEERR